MTDHRSKARRMVETQIARRGVSDSHVLRAMAQAPRERFVDAHMADLAYEDMPLPIGQGQTISQPYIVAAMIEAAGVRPGDRVLEVGAGSGYAAAVLGLIAKQVYAVERLETLAALARQRLAALGYRNVQVLTGDGARGLPDHAPFDAILVSAGAPSVPAALKQQLATGGRLVIPVGGHDGQRLKKIIRRTEDRYEEQDLEGVLFVPLVGVEPDAPDRP